jgi:NADH:ubiquinone reductase (non-electrogenic)
MLARTAMIACVASASAYSVRPRASAIRMQDVASAPASSVTANADGKVLPTGSKAWCDTVYADRTRPTEKEKVVVLGSGWGAVKFVQNIDTTKMDVTVISPRNFFLFTPFLPSVTVGTVESRTVVESMRSLVQYDARPIGRKIKDKLSGNEGLEEEAFETARYMESACVKIDPENNRVFCEDVSTSSEKFTISYDKLVVAVGGQPDTFNTPGVREHALFLKEVEDAMSIRKKILDAFEGAALVSDPEEKARRAAFVVVGAGPTGLEFAAELSDCIREDFEKLFPEEVAASSVSLVSSSPNLLASYDKRVSDFTGALLGESEVTLKTGKRVVEVKKDGVVIKDKKTKEVYEIPSAVTLWSTGVAPIGVIKDFMTEVPEQTKRHGVYVDRQLKAFGTDNVFALGDCASVMSRGKLMIDDLKASYEAKATSMCDLDGECQKAEDLIMSKAEAMSLMDDIEKKYETSNSFTQAGLYQARIRGILDRDLSDDEPVTYASFNAAVDDCYSGLRSLPPTAQVAGQQGTYLASQFNGESDSDFKYFHKGSMAYVGQNKAAAQVSMLKSLLPDFLQKVPIIGEDIVITGTLAEYVWRFLYLDMQISNKNKVQVAFDWLKISLFGRCVSRY